MTTGTEYTGIWIDECAEIDKACFDALSTGTGVFYTEFEYMIDHTEEGCHFTQAEQDLAEMEAIWKEFPPGAFTKEMFNNIKEHMKLNHFGTSKPMPDNNGTITFRRYNKWQQP